MGLLERCSHQTQVIGDECQPKSPRLMEKDLESTHHPSSVDLPLPKSLPTAGDPGRNSGDRGGNHAAD